MEQEVKNIIDAGFEQSDNYYDLIENMLNATGIIVAEAGRNAGMDEKLKQELRKSVVENLDRMIGEFQNE